MFTSTAGWPVKPWQKLHQALNVSMILDWKWADALHQWEIMEFHLAKFTKTIGTYPSAFNRIGITICWSCSFPSLHTQHPNLKECPLIPLLIKNRFCKGKSKNKGFNCNVLLSNKFIKELTSSYPILAIDQLWDKSPWYIPQDQPSRLDATSQPWYNGQLLGSVMWHL